MALEFILKVLYEIAGNQSISGFNQTFTELKPRLNDWPDMNNGAR